MISVRSSHYDPSLALPPFSELLYEYESKHMCWKRTLHTYTECCLLEIRTSFGRIITVNSFSEFKLIYTSLSSRLLILCFQRRKCVYFTRNLTLTRRPRKKIPVEFKKSRLVKYSRTDYTS